MPRTVIVIGAGSSRDLGGEAFMTGLGLLDRIQALLAPEYRNSMSDEKNAFHLIASQHLGSDGRRVLREASNRMLPLIATFDSIDQLISHAASDEVSRVAKMCIAYIVGQSEVVSREHLDLLSTAASRDKWLPTFLRNHLDGCKNADDAVQKLSDVAFVVFNYDRLVEQAILSFLRDRYTLSDAQSLLALSALTIIHPYGHLGHLQSQDLAPLRYDALAQFRRAFRDQCGKVADGLLTFGESRRDDIHRQVQDAVDSCRNLIFVGFGFGEANLDLICPAENTSAAKAFYATTTGISDRRWESLERRTLQRMARSSNQQKSLMLGSVYDAGRILRATSCDELVNDYGLRW